MKALKVVSIQRGCVYDGPGVRTVVFLKGCIFSCPWCCNPETISYKDEYYVDFRRCLTRKGISSILCNGCVETGGEKGIEQCPFGISEPVSKSMYESEILAELLKDQSLFQGTGGGVTFSGGEPLLYSHKLFHILESLFDEGVSVYFETTLSISSDIWLPILPYIDGFIVDLKLQPQTKLYDDSYIKNISKNLSLLINKDVVYRMVFVNEVCELNGYIIECLHNIGIGEIELLPCHNLGSSKYEKLGLTNRAFYAGEKELEKFSKILNANNIKTHILRL